MNHVMELKIASNRSWLQFGSTLSLQSIALQPQVANSRVENRPCPQCNARPALRERPWPGRASATRALSRRPPASLRWTLPWFRPCGKTLWAKPFRTLPKSAQVCVRACVAGCVCACMSAYLRCRLCWSYSMSILDPDCHSVHGKALIHLVLATEHTHSFPLVATSCGVPAQLHPHRG